MTERPRPLSVAEVARLLGLSPMLVDRIERVALAKLRRHPTIRELGVELGLIPDPSEGIDDDSPGHDSRPGRDA